MLDDRGLPAVRGVSLEVRGGEIVGIAGVDGNGQGELVEAITGLRPALGGTIRVGGRDITGARRARRARAGHRPHRRGPPPARPRPRLHARREPRAARLPPRAVAPRGLLSPKRMDERRAPLLDEYDVRGGSDALAASLSGGNQQKVVIAREIAEEPQVTIAAQPTRGLDVGAIEFVHRRLLEQRDAGRGVLLVSLELEEIRSLADRVLVIYEGRIVAELPPDASATRSSAWRCSAGRPPQRRSSRAARGQGTITVASRLSGYVRGGGGWSRRSSRRCSPSSSAGSWSRSPARTRSTPTGRSSRAPG